MLSTRPRRSTSAASYSEDAAAKIRQQVEILRAHQGTEDGKRSTQRIRASLQVLRQLLEGDGDTNHVRDAFRHFEGFEALLDLYAFILSNLHVDGDAEGTDGNADVKDLLEILALLKEALHKHWGNRRYFRKKVHNGGWDLLSQVTTSFFMRERPNSCASNKLEDRLAASFLSVAADAEFEPSLFGGSQPAGTPHSDENNGSTLEHEPFEILDDAKIPNPEAFVLLFRFWTILLQSGHHKSTFVTAFPKLLNHLCSGAVQVLHDLHSVGLLGEILRQLDSPSMSTYSTDLCSIASHLLKLGVSDVSDAAFLYQNALRNDKIANLLCCAVKTEPVPPHVHFDLSKGYSSVELPDLRRPFPHPSSSGYTLSLWLYIEHFDPESHTTIFGAFDASQSCFLLVYLERDTHSLILQTSVSAQRPSVRFKSSSFKPCHWYHVAIVHRRPKSSSSSRASLYVDGDFVEQVKIQFPDLPALTGSGHWGDRSKGTKQRPVQAFIGTPADLASKKGPSNTQPVEWKLASAHLYGSILSDELIAVHKELGPRYYGNYQDCLGSFQTYKASAALNLRNETLHPGQEGSSDIVAAVRSKATELLPESQILFSFSPMSIIDDEQRHWDGTQLSGHISRTAQRNLWQVGRGGRIAVAINGATPAINASLAQGHGLAILTGQSLVVTPLPLDEMSFSVGGCVPVCLALIEAATNANRLIRALEILFCSIKYSWRNSEAMERDNGYSILASLLEAKLQAFAIPTRPTHQHIRAGYAKDEDEVDNSSGQDHVLEILHLVLDFVGYQKDAPEDSVINNPLAYRVLLVDMDAWRTAGPAVQTLYYEQFATFIKGSKYHLFNAKRLARMRILKKWLDALKGEPFYANMVNKFIAAFKQLFVVAPTTESMRSLALYIAYARETPSKSPTYGLRHTRSTKFNNHSFGTPPRRSTAPVAVDLQPRDNAKTGPLDPRHLGTAMLRMYADVICQGDASVAKKFARSVSSKWMLNLMGDEDATVAILATKILVKTSLVNGAGYVDKFCSDRTCGPTIMKNCLYRHWQISDLWLSLLCLLFGHDISKVDFSQPLDIAHLTLAFPVNQVKVEHQAIFPVITTALQYGLKKAVMQPDASKDPLSPSCAREDSQIAVGGSKELVSPPQAISVFDSERSKHSDTGSSPANTSTIEIVIRFLSHLHLNSQAFRDFCLTSDFTKDLIFMLYPLVVTSDIVSPETELYSKDSSLTFDGEDVVIRPISRSSEQKASIVRTLPVDIGTSPNHSKARPLRRTSSYVLVTSYDTADDLITPLLQIPFSPSKRNRPSLRQMDSRLVEEVLELLIAVYSDQLFTRKDFAGFGLYKRLPPGFQEHQAYFASFVLRNALIQLSNAVRLDQSLLHETRVLTNIAKLALHLRESVFEGWFIDGAEPVLEFLGGVLEHLQRPEVSKIKAVRLCSETIASIRWVVERIVLLRMSEIDTSPDCTQTVALLQKITYWHNVIFANEGAQPQFMKLFFYLLYTKLVSHSTAIAENATNLWRILLVQQPGWQDVVQNSIRKDTAKLAEAFEKILELDNNAFLSWLHVHRDKIDAIVFAQPAELWEDFVKVENQRTEESAKERVLKRREILRQWAAIDARTEEVMRKHETSAGPWRANIYRQEHGKRLKAIQDEQDNRAFNLSCWTKMKGQMQRPNGFLGDGSSLPGWQLDRTEGPNRMRLRMVPDFDAPPYKYQTKETSIKGRGLSVDIQKTLKSNIADSSGIPASSATPVQNVVEAKSANLETQESVPVDAEDEFEMVEEMNDGVDGFEDKNRKVMRSLERGDRVENVYNTAQIIGLEAVEAILIIGKSNLYLIDNYFVRSDNEIVNIWHAPDDERDSYLQLISGRQTKERQHKSAQQTHETRRWRWEDVLSISKRRFLFREVAIEIFFIDGQSFLLAMAKPGKRDELHSKLYNKAQHVAGGHLSAKVEDSWRLDLLRTPEDIPQSFGSRFSNVFNNSSSNVATRKWMKGELSNFHYLMLINTMAGRTFNDLTQYPVFPWVLADYTSEELDLSNPRTFRDLTKPMGCQTAEREAEFRERYKQFAEMGDENAPAFHYGTHYSSAMIVASYMIRLQPFVQSYLLLQGGSFDHPDRMFYSLEKAWNSASKDNMSDVRELIPEFFYLPEMFVNTNGYDFGSRQGTGGRIDHVALPPWAKGDPKIFVTKHREALESEYVSKHLHAWIDLVFGHKQVGEAALEATNVFHHLSYQGARDLDEIQDPVERLATIGIIHNFGQTPHQVFQRTHPAREDPKHRPKKLDLLVENLTKLPFPVLEAPERIAHLDWDKKREKLVCSGPLKLNVPPFYDQYVEWGLIDGGIRFYNADTHKLVGLFEHVHQTQLNAVTFIDSRTLVTAGLDCVVSAWTITSSKTGNVEMTLKASFFGHQHPVSTMTASASFSTLITADTSGMVLLWDLNRLELVRVLVLSGGKVDCMAVNSLTGMILLCRGPSITLFTLNGALLVEQHVGSDADDVVSACAFYAGTSNAEYVTRQLFFTGHKRGVANCWAVVCGGKGWNGGWGLEHVKRMNHTEGHEGRNTGASITVVLPKGLRVYTGDDDGRVYEWDCVQHG